ncbi:hypothetical protein B0T25DRAFT_576585 [Lasiosphaeria hispida]|uniref:Uncharacterized protein n=1 Tax=Lasiosphaeria hispida TaxID=260671 RepID=A0AAJ0HWP9_9PEZI|nr:hypothetical protein B0T25DRAFT_576585 [Lasiosphaeria hispida]
MAPFPFSTPLPFSAPKNNNLLITEEQDKMIADTIKAVLKYVPPTPESADGQFDIVARVGNNSIKVKRQINDETTRLVDTVSASAASLPWAPTELAKSVAIMTTPFILGGLGGLAI